MTFGIAELVILGELLALATILYGAGKWIWNNVIAPSRDTHKELIIEIERKEWTHAVHAPMRFQKFEVNFSYLVKFINRLGETTTIDEIMVQYSDGNTTPPIPEQIILSPNEIFRKHYMLILGTNTTRLEATLIVSHTLGQVRVPISEKYEELDNILASHNID